jgi:hypothetical protein
MDFMLVKYTGVAVLQALDVRISKKSCVTLRVSLKSDSYTNLNIHGHTLNTS